MSDIVLYFRNKYLNLKPSELLSREVGRVGKLCVSVGFPHPILNITPACTVPVLLGAFKDLAPSMGTGRQKCGSAMSILGQLLGC